MESENNRLAEFLEELESLSYGWISSAVSDREMYKKDRDSDAPAWKGHDTLILIALREEAFALRMRRMVERLLEKHNLSHSALFDDAEVTMSKKTKWVDARRRKPPRVPEGQSESALVLCYETAMSLNPFVGWYDYDDEAWHVAHWTSSDEDVEVSWWRPLPAPPPGEEWDT